VKFIRPSRTTNQANLRRFLCSRSNQVDPLGNTPINPLSKLGVQKPENRGSGNGTEKPENRGSQKNHFFSLLGNDQKVESIKGSKKVVS
jgi:hypothetical protein